MGKRIRINTEAASSAKLSLSADDMVKKTFHAISPTQFYDLSTDCRVNGRDKRLFYSAGQVREHKADFSIKQRTLVII